MSVRWIGIAKVRPYSTTGPSPTLLLLCSFPLVPSLGWSSFFEFIFWVLSLGCDLALCNHLPNPPFAGAGSSLGLSGCTSYPLEKRLRESSTCVGLPSGWGTLSNCGFPNAGIWEVCELWSPSCPVAAPFCRDANLRFSISYLPLSIISWCFVILASDGLPTGSRRSAVWNIVPRKASPAPCVFWSFVRNGETNQFRRRLSNEKTHMNTGSSHFQIPQSRCWFLMWWYLSPVSWLILSRIREVLRGSHGVICHILSVWHILIWIWCIWL